MYTSTLSTLALALLPLISAQTSDSNCTAFTWDQQPGYLVYDTTETQRISASSSCPASPSAFNASHECPITAEGDVSVYFSHNLSLPFRNPEWNVKVGDGATIENFLRSIILPQVNTSLAGAGWNASLIGAIDTTMTLEPGESGYIQFTPLKRCFVGTLSNCTGELSDGLAVEACAGVAMTVNNRVTLVEGNATIFEITNGSTYNDPFGNQSSGQDGAGSVVRVGMGAAVGMMAVLGFAIWL
jgi:hypothetical protein